MITKMHIENFKCFKDFDIELGPFNVLIGPNDSGKTAFLQAVQLVGHSPFKQTASEPSVVASKEREVPVGPHCIWRQNKNLEIHIVAHAGPVNSHQVVLKVVLKPSSSGDRMVCDQPDNGKESYSAPMVSYLNFDPQALRLPSLPSARLTANGEGLPAFIDAIHRNPNRSLFANLEAQFRKQFPHYAAIAIEIVQLPSGHAFHLSFQPTSGQLLPAENVSDGLMLSLAFMAISQTPQPPSILLIEEPENGVHHASLKTIIETLRELNKKGVQIILTTHSPYLLDLVDPEEVRVFEKDEQGAVHAKKLSDFPDLERLKKHFMTGEIWTMLDKAKAEQV